MKLNSEGYFRPAVSGVESVEDRSEAEAFAKVCPGASLRAPDHSGKKRHATFGAYVEAWQGWANDPEFRFAGSSGGVLSALANWLVESGQARSVAGSGMGKSCPTRTVPIEISSREEALASAGSRYAPVANTERGSAPDAFIGKPCEVSARFQLAANGSHADRPHPLQLSFFCAGTPSQHATNDLATNLGVDLDKVAALRYRGRGWPGDFEVRTSDGETRRLSYEESWGSNLGRRLQFRCKICVDGTGEHADISVGDYWVADSNGFPSFSESDGNSVVIARTERGAALLSAAVSQGVLHLEPVDLDDVAAMQPLQTERRRTLAGRLFGRRAAGYQIPRYRGYGLWRHAVAHGPSNLRSAAGTLARSIGVRH